MNALLIAGFVLATVAVTLAMIQAPIIAYVIWKFVYTPWKVMRTDVIALNAKIASLEQQARVRSMSDADIARAEAKLNARQKARLGLEDMTR